MFYNSKSALSGLVFCALSLLGCASPQNIEPIAGQTFIVEDRSRKVVWDAAVAALEDGGQVEDADFGAGQIRGYAGVGVNQIAVLIALNQLYQDEDVYTVSVAGEPVAPLGNPEKTHDNLMQDIQRNLRL